MNCCNCNGYSSNSNATSKRHPWIQFYLLALTHTQQMPQHIFFITLYIYIHTFILFRWVLFWFYGMDRILSVFSGKKCNDRGIIPKSTFFSFLTFEMIMLHHMIYLISILLIIICIFLFIYAFNFHSFYSFSSIAYLKDWDRCLSIQWSAVHWNSV